MIQVLYAATGCDFTSFFSGISKVAFLDVFYRYPQFIASNTPRIPGSITDIDPDSNGFLAFVRLVGVAYFCKNKPAFENPSPSSYFDTFENEDPKLQHCSWYKAIRSKIWERELSLRITSHLL